jgi:putative Ca2+/H+ antiporter (TMEM165/GDT1 family)
MELKLFLPIFSAVFLAELGDKTQLATMAFAANKEASKLTVFAASSLALVLSSAIGVAVGAMLSNHINEKYLNYCAGIFFILIGGFTLWKA